MKIPFSPPRMDQKIVDEVVDTLKSGWITTGPKTKEFERELTAYCGNKATLAVNSNTIGLEVVLRWFGVQEGDEVIVPAYTYCATANVIVHCGAKPVMVDVRADDFDISVENVRKALTPRTKVVMPVDLGGMPCDYDAVFALVESEEARAMFSPRTEEQRELGRVLVVSMISIFGTVHISANAVANNLDSMGCIVGQAMGLAMITVVGRCVGAGDLRQAGYFAKKLLLWDYLVQGASNALVLIFLPQLLGMYTLSEETWQLAWLLVSDQVSEELLCRINAELFPVVSCTDAFSHPADFRHACNFSLENFPDHESVARAMVEKLNLQLKQRRKETV